MPDPGYECCWSENSAEMEIFQEGRSVKKVKDFNSISVALSETLTSEFAQLEAFFHGESKNYGLGLSVRRCWQLDWLNIFFIWLSCN